MKRTIVGLSVLSALAALTVACGSDPSTLSNESADTKGTIGGDTEKDNSAKDAKSDKAATPAPAASSAASNTTTPPKTTSSNTAACDPNAAKTAADCTKCCAEKAAPDTTKAANDCACGTSSKCAQACGDNICKGGFPNLECGACLLEAKCDLGNDLGGLGALLGGANGGGAASDAAACFKICEAKP